MPACQPGRGPATPLGSSALRSSNTQRSRASQQVPRDGHAWAPWLLALPSGRGGSGLLQSGALAARPGLRPPSVGALSRSWPPSTEPLPRQSPFTGAVVARHPRKDEKDKVRRGWQLPRRQQNRATPGGGLWARGRGCFLCGGKDGEMDGPPSTPCLSRARAGEPGGSPSRPGRAPDQGTATGSCAGRESRRRQAGKSGEASPRKSRGTPRETQHEVKASPGSWLSGAAGVTGVIHTHSAHHRHLAGSALGPVQRRGPSSQHGQWAGLPAAHSGR